MQNIVNNLVVFTYGIAVLLIFLYTVSQFFLFLAYFFNKRENHAFQKDFLPKVTIQLPIYNEKYVVKRLLENIALIDYPHEKLEIQILDDSSDDSLENNKLLTLELANKGFDAVHIYRSNRENYKAGALKAGLEIAKGEFIVVFDADFLPQKDWLLKTIPYFCDERVGVVQTRWEHINRNFSIETQVLAMALDHHFTVEQTGRNIGNHFINFNGTAGVLRKSCIIDAGNWEGDTLTEDLDLSYRAQLKDWKFIYLEEVGTPSELPVAISAVRSQQFRWNKGGAENFRKNIKKVIKSKVISFQTKLHAFAHLFNSSVFVWVFIVSILSVPMVKIGQNPTFFDGLLILGTFLKFNFFSLMVIFYVTFRKIQSKKLKDLPQFVFQFLVFFPVILGLTFHNTMAVLEGYFGIKSEFIRTPKFNVFSKNDEWRSNQYIKTRVSGKIWLELALILYFSFGIYLDFQMKDFSYIQFHVLLVFGYLFVFSKSICQ